MPRGAIHQIHEAIHGNECRYGAFRQRIDAPGVKYCMLEWGNAARVRLLKTPYGDQGIFVERATFEAIDGFPDVHLMEDLLLIKRLRCRGRPLLLPGPLYVHPRRLRQNGVVRQTLRNWSSLIGYKLGVPVNRLADFYPRHDAG